MENKDTKTSENENERIWTQERSPVPGAPLDPPMVITFYMRDIPADFLHAGAGPWISTLLGGGDVTRCYGDAHARPQFVQLVELGVCSFIFGCHVTTLQLHNDTAHIPVQ